MSGAALTTAAALLLLLVLAARRGELLAAVASAEPVAGDEGDEASQGGAALEASALLGSLDVSDYLYPIMSDIQNTDEATEAANVAAFLATIRRAEGTHGPNGYRTLFGGRLFDSFADHPRIAQRFTDGAGRQLWTTAAGAYQFLAVSPLPSGGATRVDTWDRMAARLGLPDFSPASQDAAAVELIRDAGALADVRAGRFDAAVSKVRRVWASLPGAGYAQPEKSIDYLRAVYAGAGGSFA